MRAVARSGHSFGPGTITKPTPLSPQRYLALAAFRSVLQRKQSRHRGFLEWIGGELEGRDMRAAAACLRHVTAPELNSILHAIRY